MLTTTLTLTVHESHDGRHRRRHRRGRRRFWDRLRWRPHFHLLLLVLALAACAGPVPTTTPTATSSPMLPPTPTYELPTALPTFTPTPTPTFLPYTADPPPPTLIPTPTASKELPMARATAQITLTVNSQSLQWVGDPNLALAGEQGMDIPFSLQVQNNGTGAVTYDFVSSFATGLDLSVTLDDNTYNRTVAAGATDSLAGHIHIGPAVSPGDYPIDISLN